VKLEGEREFTEQIIRDVNEKVAQIKKDISKVKDFNDEEIEEPQEVESRSPTKKDAVIPARS